MTKYKVVLTPEFEKEFSKLQKKFPKMDDDFENFLNEIELEGDLGDPIPGVHLNDGNKVFKKRMKNTSARQGKSGGFRIINYLVTSDNKVYLLDIYSKNDKEDIPKRKILALVKKNKHFSAKMKK